MKTPERSVEEYRYYQAPNAPIAKVFAQTNDGTRYELKEVTKTLQAERQKCDEMVEAEREFLTSLYVTSPSMSAEEYSDSNQELSCFQDGFDDAKSQIENKIITRLKALTQTNNPK